METETLLPVVAPSDSATRTHHKFGPSRMEYLDNCAAFENRFFESEASEEGTMLHDIMDAIVKRLRLYRNQPDQYATTLEQIGDWVTVNHELTEEQVMYLRFCCKRLDAVLARNPNKILSEISIKVQNEDGTEFNHGYLDVVFFFANGAAILVDFKFGYIPVPHASINLQGMNYMVGIFQMFPEVTRVGVKFMQPKLHSVSEAVFERSKIYDYYLRLRRVVEQAKFVQSHPDQAQNFMRPGTYCDYCALAGTCAVLANHRASFASQFGNLPAPVPIAELQIHKLEDWAFARYYIDVIEKGLEDFKKRAQEVAEQNGGELRCTLPNGEEIVYEMRERNGNRSLGDTRSIAEALQEYVTFEEILGAADLALTRLEPIVKTAMVEKNKAENGPKLTKKAAWEQATATLEALGLLTKPDTKIRFLQQKKQQKTLEAGAPPSNQISDAATVQET